jgi:hypothetical protein
MPSGDRKYRFLDDDQDRIEMLADIRRTRRAVIDMAEHLPPLDRYTPRYYGWTMAAVLTELYLSDRLTMAGIELALLRIPPLRFNLLAPFNRLTASLFQHRSVELTLRAIRRYERCIADLVLSLPIDKFSRPVYDPAHRVVVTVEQTMQEGFLFHWQDTLLALQRVEGIYYEPPERPDFL